ncbi:MAG: polyprenyl synthetase family protein [Brevundimonas sp.]
MDAALLTATRPKGDVETLARLAKGDMAAVDALILDRMQSQVPVIPLLAEHIVSAGGKRLRPLLTIAAARAVGATEVENALKLAASVEFIHTATLLHDDVVDGSERRRGKVAAHLIWGSATSVLVGDFLFARAFELMVETGAIRALGILAQASGVIAQGEVLQLTRAHDLNLGLAFQLADDALDYGGSSEALGKNAGDDFREGKVTLPLLLAVARTRGREDAFWDRTINRNERSDEDFRRARELILGTGAVSATLDAAGDYADAAKAALKVLPRSDWRSALESLADFAVSRAS